jgi:hypothetical protein
VNLEILSEEAQRFINDNLTSDIHTILLKKSPFPNLTTKELVEQIESKIKSKYKLPSWFAAENIYYPNKLNLSQTSSEIAADYKATLVHGEKIADLTGGLGVDSFAFSKKFKEVIHLEQNQTLSKIANYNFKQLGAANIECISQDGISYIENTTRIFDWIYLDPSRRDKENKKVYYLSDCEPNVTTHLDVFFSKSKNILLKTGPLLDLNIGLKELGQVKEIHIVAIANEVKEILWILELGYTSKPLIKTVNFKNDDIQHFQFGIEQEQTASSTFSLPQTYLYEPNAAILKSGAFNFIGQHYNLDKLHPNSHLYTSDNLITFPGRIFEIKNILDYSKKSIKKIGLSKANVATRNFPDSVAKIRKKLDLKDGGEIYIFCTTDSNQKKIVTSHSELKRAAYREEPSLRITPVK